MEEQRIEKAICLTNDSLALAFDAPNAVPRIPLRHGVGNILRWFLENYIMQCKAGEPYISLQDYAQQLVSAFDIYPRPKSKQKMNAEQCFALLVKIFKKKCGEQVM